MGCLLLTAPAEARNTFPAAAGDDVARSMGKFAIWIHPTYRPLVQTNPCFTNSTGEFVSPLMFDPNTIIGRSAPYDDGDATDIGPGSPLVGTDALAIPRSVFFTPPYLVPSMNFTDGPNGTREIRTRVKSLHMVSRDNNFHVRAGNLAGVSALSPGQVEDTSPDPNDFPAESFFDIFAEIDINLPGLGSLETDGPLLVTNPSLPDPNLPPDVVYIHGETPAVPVRFKANQGINSGRLLGYLRLAGHGVSFDCQCDPNQPGGARCQEPDCSGNVPAGPPICPDAQRLQQALAEAPRMLCVECNDGIVPTLGTTGYVILLVLLLGAGTIFILRRQSARVS
jgi:hypothetical protein